MSQSKVTCPCCGYKTLTEERAWEICHLCGWEDDEIQFDIPDFRGGANPESLIEAQKHFLKHHANDEEKKYYEKDETWKPYEQRPYPNTYIVPFVDLLWYAGDIVTVSTKGVN